MSVIAPDRPKIEAKPKAAVSPLVRWLAHRWYLLFIFLGLGLVGNILAVFLAQGPTNWWPSIESQFNEVITVVTSYPLPSAAVLLTLAGLTILGGVENARIAREDEEELTRRQHQIATEAAREHVAPVAATAEAASQQAQ